MIIYLAHRCQVANKPPTPSYVLDAQLSLWWKRALGADRSASLGVGWGFPLNLDSDCFCDEDAARRKLEALRWPDGVVCCHCGTAGTARRITSNPGNRIRAGLYRCGSCRRQFTVTVGTIFESSHIPLHKWFQAVHLLSSAGRPVSAKAIERTLGVTYKSAWTMVQRLRKAEVASTTPRAANPIPRDFRTMPPIIAANEAWANGNSRSSDQTDRIGSPRAA